MAEELERDLFDEMLKKSSSNIIANPKKEWTPEEAETSENKEEIEQTKNKEDEQA
ncbi:MAG: hypothetical protein HYZ42_08915 [Bacteroidetes bacterium]|nr:hypothetical protein [Bacteroidota bacterium]